MSNEKTLRYPLFFHYHVVPTISVLFFIGFTFCLAIIAQGHEVTLQLILENLSGDATSWKFVLIFYAWTILWLRLPSKIEYGSETKFGTRPCIRANGVLYYCITLAAFLLLQLCHPNTSTLIYTHYLKILGAFNVISIILCICLYIKGKWKPEHPEDPDDRDGSFIYKFFAGIEFHPRLFGCDMKQLNVRIGFMGWQLFVCAFYLTGVDKRGFNAASLVHLLIQSLHVAKFFCWELGYFFSFDMYEKVGFYLCWGSMVSQHVLFTFAAAYSIVNPPTSSPITSILIGFFGATCTFLAYKVDSEKQVFKQSTNYECVIWGKPAKYILAEYKDWTGKMKKSALLTSGFWGLGRHMNYTFEIGTAFAFCACLGFTTSGLLHFLYFFYAVLFIPHRLSCDEEKNRKKYGQYWEKYCSQVPYKMIPNIW